MSGFENDVLLAKNVNFNTLVAKPHTGIITLAGQVLIGTGNDGSVINQPAIKAGFLNAASSGISITYNSGTGNIDFNVGAGQTVTFQADSGSAVPSGNILNVFGAGGTTTSASGNTITITGGGGGGSTVQFNVDTGISPVSPVANLITLHGTTVAAGTNPIRTDGTGGNNIAIELQRSQALAAADSTKIGLCNFYSSQFTVDANGFVQLVGGASPPTLSMTVDAFSAPGTQPVTPNGSGSLILTGNQVASGVVGSNVIRSDSLAANTITLEIQRATSAAIPTLAANGISHYDSGKFTVDANGFVTLASTVFGTITGDSGGALPQTAGNWNILGSGSITTAGAGSTLTVELQGLTNHAVLVGAGTTTITKVGPSATSGQILQSQGLLADPAFSTATYPSTTTINQILYSSSANTVTGLATANKAVLTTGATGTPVLTQIASDGQIIIGSTAGVPAAATLTAGTGISITNGSNSITVAINPSVVGETITGNSGGVLSPTAGNWNILGSTVAAGTSPLVTAGTGSTLTINAQRSQAIASADSTKIGLSNYNSAQFTVDANGFVSLKGSSANPGILGIHPNAISGTGTDPTVADASGNVSILGLSVAAGTNPVRTVATSVNSITTLVQTSQAIAATDATKIGLSAFDSASFNVDANGFVTLATGAGIFTLSDDVNTKVSPSAGNIQLTGHVVNAGGNFSTTVSNAGSHLIAINPMSTARWIVDPLGFNGTHTTITSAMASASSGETIALLPGTYTENYTHKPGVNVVSYNADAYTPNVIIKGKVTYTGSGTASYSGIQFQTNGSNILSITGSNTLEMNYINCFFNLSFTGFSINNANSIVNCYHCKGNLTTTGISCFSVTNCNTLNFEYCYFDNSGNSLTANSIAGGNLRHWWTRFNNPISVTGSGSYTGRWARVECSSLNVTCLTLNTSDDTSNSFHCVYSSGSATAIVLTSGKLRMSFADITTTAPNAITGSVLQYGGCVFRDTSTVSVSTQTFFPMGPRIALGDTGNCQLLCGSGSPNGVVTAPKGSLYLRSDGSSSSTRAYINTNSSTGWTAITTAS